MRGEEAWLVEADPSGAVLASRAPDLAGLDSLGRIAFEPSGVPRDVEFGSASRRLGGVNVLTGPWDSFQAWSAIASTRVRWVEHLGRLDGVVVADVGSLRGGQGPAWSIIERSEVLVMVTNPEPAALTSTVAWMDAKGQSAPGVGGLSADRARLLVVDAPTASGERFSPDVAAELDGPPGGLVAVGAQGGGPCAPRRFAGASRRSASSHSCDRSRRRWLVSTRVSGWCDARPDQCRGTGVAGPSDPPRFR